MDRNFTLDEAQSLLPVLESLLKRAIEGKQQLQDYEAEFDALKSRIFIAGGTLVDVAAVASRKREREMVLQRIKDAIAEIDAIGVQVKDLDIGLLDFPCDVEGETILLCWKLGEEAITHWHGLEEGFKGRKPIDERIRQQKRKPS
ncbi:MAG TPA: DUF2203 domain-containing protein [Terriglobales bacterium]|nr:DUF2203 domain-containing protein [Terriglobales bacterium]